jgi:hypothetical protein
LKTKIEKKMERKEKKKRKGITSS